jgi:hypothetical protein
MSVAEVITRQESLHRALPEVHTGLDDDPLESLLAPWCIPFQTAGEPPQP